MVRQRRYLGTLGFYKLVFIGKLCCNTDGVADTATSVQRRCSKEPLCALLAFIWVAHCWGQKVKNQNFAKFGCGAREGPESPAQSARRSRIWRNFDYC